MKDDIEVVRIQPIENRGAVRAFVSIRIGGAIDINDCKVTERDGEDAWVAMPTVTGSDGKRRSIVWIIDGALKEAITTEGRLRAGKPGSVEAGFSRPQRRAEVGGNRYAALVDDDLPF